MDIAALSINLSHLRVNQQVDVSVLKMAMDTSEMQSIELIKMLEANTKMMEQMINPHLGGHVDVIA
ncbi:YjfB family protein [Alkalibaculum bacchi]|uniref:YjfB family protein n=1 Tax=Alkalibaculum bacchi TaxID=645887 RepID=UPI0026ECD9EF|nr:YjfB family protein [Alkalibaculum bacchi]